MRHLDLPPLSAAENLAADEVILDVCEANSGTGVPPVHVTDDGLLLFWEPRETFVVVGYANKVATEVNVPACEKARVPIYRRCSGGGTVVQMPGGLNYSLILRIEENGPTRNISSANQFIMERNRAAIETLFPGRQTPDAIPPISVRGHTDLCLGDLKFAGNSQRRRKHFLLFHGTLLLNCDLKRISELLLMPSLQPGYRASRTHEEFVTNLKLPAGQVKTALSEAWNASAPFENPPFETIKKLARQKYATREWNYKF